MKILVLGSGGREHALVWAISQNPKCEKIYCAPGNAGISQIANTLGLDLSNSNQIINFCKNVEIDLVVVGPEEPLTNGITDALCAEGILTFGPSKLASLLESSKSFTKSICEAANIPTAKSRTFSKLRDAQKYLKQCDLPIVIKVDGLAAGKGVFISETFSQAKRNLEFIFSGYFGESGERVLIEEFLEGEEVSFFAITDGKSALQIGTAQDHKRLLDGDKGPNTGGMGAFSPAPIVTEKLEEKILKKIIEPTLKVMRKNGTPFVGILYAGLIIRDKEPYLLEYNVRFGDPECQVLMRRMGGQILDIILDCLNGKLTNCSVNWAKDFAIVVVMAAKGYPENYEKRTQIKNVGSCEKIEGVIVFHAGTIMKDDILLSNGGRVLNVTSRAKSLKNARDNAYRAISLIDWPNSVHRNDIGWRVLQSRKG